MNICQGCGKHYELGDPMECAVCEDWFCASCAASHDESLDDLSNTYTWEVASESNGTMGSVKLVAPLGKRASVITEHGVIIELTEPALEGLAMALSYWLEWRKQRDR